MKIKPPYFNLLFGFVLCIITTACSDDGFKHVSFERYKHKREITNDGTETRYYIVKNYREDINTLLNISEFVLRSVEQDSQAHAENYIVYFFKESDKTNLENLLTNPKDFDRHSYPADLRYEFRWSRGGFTGLSYYRNGEAVYPPDNGEIILSEPPPLNE